MIDVQAVKSTCSACQESVEIIALAFLAVTGALRVMAIGLDDIAEVLLKLGELRKPKGDK